MCYESRYRISLSRYSLESIELMKDEDVKYQIVTLACKVYALYFPDSVSDIDSLDPMSRQIHLLYNYTMSLARYDTSYDLRDRTRFLKNSHSSPLRTTLKSPKPVPHMQSLGERNAEWSLGSLSQVIQRDMEGEMVLPEWGSEIPDKGVRDVEVVQTNTAAPAVGTSVVPVEEERKEKKKVWKDLDKFYASESEEESEESSEEDEEDEEEEEEGDEELEEEEEEEEDDEEEEEIDEGNERQRILSSQNEWR